MLPPGLRRPLTPPLLTLGALLMFEVGVAFLVLTQVAVLAAWQGKKFARHLPQTALQQPSGRGCKPAR